MGFIDFVKSFFEESEEELLEDIKEAEKLKKYAEKRLNEVRKAKKQRKKLKPMPLKHKLLILAGIMIIVALTYGIYKYKTTFHFKCNDVHQCEDCKFLILCPQFEELGQEEHYIHFILENRKDESVGCKATITLEKLNSIISNKTVELGVVQPNTKQHFKVAMQLPSGDSVIKVEPICE